LRWKLLIVASLAAALVGAGACYSAAYFILDTSRNLRVSGWLAAATLLVPLAAITYASIFVYRHTARRRTLQAVSTALLALMLTLASLFIASIVIRRPSPEILPPAKLPSNTS
jgi:hypothetical protein